jgi:hypothetical protein
MKTRPQSPNFPDPYADTPDDRCDRTAVTIDKLVTSHFNTCRPARATLQITINILVQKLYEQLRTAGIESYNPTAYESVVNGCAIVLGRADGVPGSTEPIAQPPSSAETPARNDGRGTPSAALVNPRPRRKSSNPRSAPAESGTFGESK